MSRIIVKGLPVYLTDDKLKEHFIKRINKNHSKTVGTNELITDIKVLKDRNGQSRRFAFIGFRNESDAFDAIDYFNGSYIDTAKIEVSMAKSFADPGVPQSMREKKREALKRFREREETLLEETNAKKPKNQQQSQKRLTIDAEIEKNKQLQEFIDTMKPSSKMTSWESTSATKATSVPLNPLLAEEDEETQDNPLLAQALAMKDEAAIPDEESDDEYVSLKKDTGEEEEAKESEEKMMSLENYNTEYSEDKEGDSLAQDDKVSDLDWFKQRRVRIRDGENEPVKRITEESKVVKKEEAKEENKEEDQQIEEDEKQISDEEKAIEKITKSGRLFLRNILYTSTESDFRQLFSPFGELEEVHIALDTRTGQSKGFAYVLFKDPSKAVQAYIELDKQIYQGRLLHILPAEEKKSHRLDEFDLKNLPLKKQKELKRKDAASKQTFSWNSLYMNQDAVLSSVASKLGMEKSQLIDAENSNSAVKQALAEAHVIGDVRKYFESKGVELTKFAQLRANGQRDDHIILVKNFPFGTTREELGELFLPFGKLERFLMPPAGTIAIVQFRDLPNARSAFKSLAYKRFKDGILYLEKGPIDCFTKDAQADDGLEDQKDIPEPIKEIKPSVVDIMDTKPENAKEVETQDDIIDGPTVSIFIKNLNFTTTSQELAQKFKQFNGFVVAQVKTKPDPKSQDKRLSMGFGFAEYRTKEQALAVIAAIDGSVIDGHRVQLKLSHRQGVSTSNNNNKSKSKQSGKIIVKNLPFEATRKDIFELFSSFGQLKSVRVPKKFDKSARGFAFVEFLLPKEAENAMDQLQGVHLLGRRLVMQYAQQDAVDAEEEISRMTHKVRKQMATREYGALKSAGGRKKLEMDADEDGLNNM